MLQDKARQLDFDWFREKYDQLSLDDLKILYATWHEVNPDQHFFHLPFIEQSFATIIGETGRDDLNVVELGGYDGTLALRILENHPALNWLNVDILPHKPVAGLEGKHYRLHVLSKQIWDEKPDIKPCDVFVSSETLEHFSNHEFQRIMQFITGNNATYLILQVPMLNQPYSWQGEKSAHVLTLTQTNVKTILRKDYELLAEQDNWKCLWRNRHANRPVPELGRMRKRPETEATQKAS